MKPLCANRVLSSPSQIGPRCISVSMVNVTGTLTTPSGEIAVRGLFEVMSLRFDGHGFLRATAVDGQVLEGTLANGVLDGRLDAGDRTTTLTFSARRR